MKDKPSEWIAISDLMAGVVAVVMLLLVMSVLQKTAAEKRMAELEQASDPQQQKLNMIMGQLHASLSDTINGDMITVDTGTRKITLRDGVFNRGSACVVDIAHPALSNVQAQLIAFLESVPDGRVYVEGHTDDRPVSRPVTDYARFCTVYDDNYTLSAARARETRKVLADNLQSSDSKRIVVAGFGDSQPLEGIPPEDARQRRVEIRLVIAERTDHS
ncbi:OmpA family protein [Stenotrophomonas sp. YIM B06876]|uniref:OmpA/MotB family protein n=1 Tax=Stenotrophomonas sp. YIM B06876 TaxID=3060211 RepID=UPI0027396E17|nr:OmpA family protein [Stenotrophomonas sp. YIM B06876]